MRKSVASPVLGLLGVLAAGRAEAHFQLKAIDMTTPVSWLTETDPTGGPQKQGPCAGTVMSGETAGKPTNVVTNVKAGQMVSISVNGTVGHKGWWRVALAEGPSSSQTLTTMPEQTFQTSAMCVPSVMSNPVWSTSQPIIADGLLQGASATGTQQTGTLSLKVTIPQAASCTAAKPCSLQVMMVMTDHTAPSCYYHHCADITTSGASGNGSGGAGGGSGSGAAGGAKGMGGSSGANGSGGVSASGGANGSGGTSASGGMDGTGGSSASGGAPGTGGSSASGGASSSGGAVASGGATSSGGKSGSGGASGSGGSSTSSGSGGTTSPGADSSSSGCAIATRGEAAFAPFAALLLVALARRRRAG
jgi:hypothetical protein